MREKICLHAVECIFPSAHAQSRFFLLADLMSFPRVLYCTRLNTPNQVCRQTFMSVSNDAMLASHVTAKHAGKKTPAECFPGRLT